MGTTLVALLLRNSHALVAHAGDSRCYLLRAGKLERVTHDHSLVDEQMRLGAMTAEEAERSPLRSVITRAIGTQPSITEDVAEIEPQPGDVFLLCSDGLHCARSMKTTSGASSTPATIWIVPRSFGRCRQRAGGRDNVTALAVRASID